MSKGLCLGHAGANHELPQKSGQLHRFLSLQDPALGFLFVYNLLGKKKNTDGREMSRNA